jgi:hypothetical protein
VRNTVYIIKLVPVFYMSVICSVTIDACCALFIMDDSLLIAFVFVVGIRDYVGSSPG